MPKRFKTARQINKLKITEATEKLGISQREYPKVCVNLQTDVR